MRLALIFVILFILSQVFAHQYLNNGYEAKNHQFGAQYFQKRTSDSVESVVIFDSTPKNEATKYANLYSSLERLKNNKETLNDAIITCSRGKYPDFFKFALSHVATFGRPDNALETSFESPCFTSTTMRYVRVDNTTFNVEIETANSSSTLCSDFYLFGTTLNYHVENIFFHGKHVVSFKDLNEKEIRNIETYGINVFRFCDSLQNILPDIIYSSLLFIGGLGTNPDIPFFGSKPTFWMEMLNEDFIKKTTGYEWQRREEKYVDIDEKDIHSGDFIAITRFDGIDQIIHLGAGSHAGHSTVALWIDGVLHVIESQDGWYWPKHGIQRNTFKQWVEWARNAGFNVAVLPLSPEKRKIFNETAVLEWFKTVEGLPYGYHNFLFGWVDTENRSYPPILDPLLVPVVFSILEKIIPSVVNIFLNQALNKRLKTVNLTLSEIAEVLYERNMTFPQLFAVVEEEGWEYSDGVSYVCSAFVAAVYKRAGLFEGIDADTIHATEFTPRDVYSLKFFDSNYTKPAVCQEADPDLPYCQIMGKHKMVLPEYNTIEPYEHMNEICESFPPLYLRVPDRC